MGSLKMSSLVMVVLTLLGCPEHDPYQDVTGVRLTITTEIDSSSFVVRGFGESTNTFSQIVVPDEQRSLEPDGEIVDIIVDDSRGGTTLNLRVDAISWGDIFATERLEVELVTGDLIRRSIHFAPGSECGDGALDPDQEACDDGNVDDDDGCSAECELEDGFLCTTDPGQRSRCSPLCGEIVCDDGQRCVDEECICDGQSCAGCCDDRSCILGNEAEACGSGGQPCEACTGTAECVGGVCEGCDAETCGAGCCSGNSCHEATIDTCGLEGHRCMACERLVSDGCSETGECACGDGPECVSGQRCLDGVCQCDAESCPAGCCSGEACLSSTTASECGIGGDACAPCDAVTADTCNTDGECRCGTRRPCVEGQRCQSGLCICDAGSCSEGCCLDNNCVTPPVIAACGQAGAACEPCDRALADSCDVAEGCRCGEVEPCDEGQRCDEGTCVCDGLSCTGCCSDSTCLPGDQEGSCGSGGADCAPCPDSESCTDGVCSSCTAESCASGCCSGAICSPAETATCGVDGTACLFCDPLVSDSCDSGECRCGSEPPCDVGLHCVEESCDCDATSCSIGCCASGLCQERSSESCGLDGAECVTCDPQAADTCDLAGACRCGLEPPCDPEELCVGGFCV